MTATKVRNIPRLGVDFGTTNSSAAILAGETVRLIPLEGDETVMPSMIYLTRAGERIVGNAAIRTYLAQNTGRPASYRVFDLGSLTETHTSGEGPLVVIRRIYSLEDTAAPGRLFQSVKTALRDAGFQGTDVFGQRYTLEELIAIVLGHIRQRAEAHLGAEVTSLVLGRPVSYARDDCTPQEARAVEEAAVSKMVAAAHLAGFREVEFAYEPVAAAKFFQLGKGTEARAFVFDFGGGTLDLAVVDLHANGRAEVLGTRGLLIGGDDLDSRLVMGLARHFGAGSTCGPEKLPFPDNMLDYLAHWQTIPVLSRPPYLETIREIKHESSDPQAIAALECLVTRNYGFDLFRNVEQGKRALSEGPETTIVLEAEQIHLRERLLRAAFEASIADLLASIRQGVRQLLAELSLTRRDIGQVIVTGGSGLIPCVAELLAEEFGRGKLRRASAFTSIVAGLAAIAAQPGEGLTMAAPGGKAGSQQAHVDIRLGDSVLFRLGGDEIAGRVTSVSDPTGADPLLSIEYHNDLMTGDMLATVRRASQVTRVAN